MKYCVLTGFFVGVMTDLCKVNEVLRSYFCTVGVVEESRMEGSTVFSREPLNSHELRVSSLLAEFVK